MTLSFFQDDCQMEADTTVDMLPLPPYPDILEGDPGNLSSDPLLPPPPDLDDDDSCDASSDSVPPSPPGFEDQDDPLDASSDPVLPASKVSSDPPPAPPKKFDDDSSDTDMFEESGKMAQTQEATTKFLSDLPPVPPYSVMDLVRDTCPDFFDNQYPDKAVSSNYAIVVNKRASSVPSTPACSKQKAALPEESRQIQGSLDFVLELETIGKIKIDFFLRVHIYS